MSSNEHFSIHIFTDITKKICTCSAIAICLIVLFIISPLSRFYMTSIFMKLLILALLVYTIYLNSLQTNYLSSASQMDVSKEVSNQLTINLMCSYLFTMFMGLMVIFVLRSFFI